MYAGISSATKSARAGNNLEGLKFRIVNLTGTEDFVDLTAAGLAYGVLVNDPRSGEHASVAFADETKVQVGTGGLAVGQFFTSAATGFAVGVASGAATARLFGRHVGAVAVTSGGIARVLLERWTSQSGQAL